MKSADRNAEGMRSDHIWSRGKSIRFCIRLDRRREITKRQRSQTGSYQMTFLCQELSKARRMDLSQFFSCTTKYNYN